MEKYVVYHDVDGGATWYVSDIRFYDRPEIDWILNQGECREVENAMVFNNRLKAYKIAEILSSQESCKGFTLWRVRGLQ